MVKKGEIWICFRFYQLRKYGIKMCVKKRRVLIVGAGFSKAIANAPLANEFLGPIYEFVKNDGYSKYRDYEDGKRSLLRLIQGLSESVEEGLNFVQKDGTKVANANGIDLISSINIENLMTLLDINIERPFIPIGDGVDLQGCPIPYMKGFNTFNLEDSRKLIEHFIVKFLLPDALKPKQDLLLKFAEFIQPGDLIITFNYDLLIEQALWKAKLWSPQDGYLLGEFSGNLIYDKSKLFKNKVPILKLHGSINWHKAGRFCDNVQIDLSHPKNYQPYFEGLDIDFHVKRNPRDKYYGHYLIAPTFMKTYRSKYEVHLVRQACDVISKSNEIYTIGYSFPEADALASFMLAQINPDSRIIIVNRNADKMAEGLSRDFGFKRNNIINEQSKIEDWIACDFQYPAYEHYLEGKRFMDDMIKHSEQHN